MTEKLEKDHLTDEKNNRSLVLGSIVATLIAITPYLFYLYDSVPREKVWNTFLFTYDSKGWGDANYVIWILAGKLIPLLLLFIWFFTCRHWWYHALLVPIAMYVFQILSLLNDDLNYVDEFQLIYLVPIMSIIIPSIYLVRAKLFNKMNSNKSLKELEDEFTLRPKGLLGRFKDYF